MKLHFSAVCLTALATSGCGQMMSFIGLDRGETRTPQAAMSLSEPIRTVQPTRGGSWENKVARDIPYFNMSALPVPVYSDAERTEKVGSLPPGEGGFVETCSDARPICKIAYAGTSSGWVMMDRMGGVTN